jgi:hypothetical protein
MPTAGQFQGEEREARLSARALADQAFSRAAGAPLIEGNGIRLLKDAGENYPAWLDAIRRAERAVHFENYFLRTSTPSVAARRPCAPLVGPILLMHLYPAGGHFSISPAVLPDLAP